jgi:hypothetical protein
MSTGLKKVRARDRKRAKLPDAVGAEEGGGAAGVQRVPEVTGLDQ